MIRRRRKRASVVNNSILAASKSRSFDQIGTPAARASASSSVSSGSRRPILRTASGMLLEYSDRGTTVTGSAATASRSRSGRSRFFSPRITAYSSTSAKVCSVVKTCSMLGWVRISRARPPSTEDNSTLASAASFTARLSPFAEVAKRLRFGDPLFLELTSNLQAQHGEKLASQVNRQRGIAPGKEYSSDPAAARDEYRIFGP